jgi:hypothetical protein
MFDHFDSLESRRLMSVVLSGSTLIVYGTNKPDVISMNDGTTGQILVTDNGRSSRWTTSAVSQIRVYGYDGNDSITTYNMMTKPMLVYAGDGNDTVVSGGGNDTLYGERRNDRIYAGFGSDDLYGGAGDDMLMGQAGSDRHFGSSGNDVLDMRDGVVGNDAGYGQADFDQALVDWTYLPDVFTGSLRLVSDYTSPDTELVSRGLTG